MHRNGRAEKPNGDNEGIQRSAPAGKLLPPLDQRDRGRGGGPKAQGLGTEHRLSCGSWSHRGLPAAISDLQTQTWREHLQPPTGSSHWLNLATGASGTEACRGHSLSLCNQQSRGRAKNGPRGEQAQPSTANSRTWNSAWCRRHIC